MELREFNTNQKIYATPEQWDTLDRLVSIIKKGDTNQVVKAVLIDSIDISDHVLHKQFLQKSCEKAHVFRRVDESPLKP